MDRILDRVKAIMGNTTPRTFDVPEAIINLLTDVEKRREAAKDALRQASVMYQRSIICLNEEERLLWKELYESLDIPPDSLRNARIDTDKKQLVEVIPGVND